MKIKISVCLLIVVAAQVLTAQPKSDQNSLTVAEAERRIGVHIKFIEKRAGEMVAAYYYTGAQATLEQSFRKAGVTTSMTYADPWGKNGIGLFWSENVKKFYEYHQDALQKSLTAIKTRGSVSKSEIDFLDKGMEAWKQHDQDLLKQFGTLVENYTKSALINDEKEKNEVTYGGRMARISAARPFRSDQYEAVKAEWGRANKVLDEKNKVLGTELDKIREAIAKKASERLFGPLDDKTCSNGAERLLIDRKQTKKWELAESIEIARSSAVYLKSDKRPLKTLSTVTEVLDLLEKIGALPDDGVEIPMKYFKEIIKRGDEIVQAAGRLSAAEKKKLIDLVVKINRVEVTVECVAVEICENGKWVRKGVKQAGEPTRRNLPPLIREEQGVLAGELWQRIDKNSRSYAELQKRFDADPCAGIQPAPVDTPKPPSQPCENLLSEIETLKEQKASIEKQDLPAARERLERAERNLAEWRSGLDEHKEGLSRAIRLAEGVLKTKQAALRLAEEKKANLDKNKGAPNWREMMTAAETRVAEAEKAVVTAKAAVEAAKERRVQADKETASREAMVTYRKEKVEELTQASAELQKNITRLQRDYDACKR